MLSQRNVRSLVERGQRRLGSGLVLAWVWGCLFAVNMVLKEASMSRYPEWAAYKKRSWWLLPFVL